MSTNTTSPSKSLNISLWVLQILLAGLFLMAGASKFFTPLEGLAEILGGLGLILPAILKIMPWLISIAALGLAIVMVLAAVLNGSICETKAIMPTLLIAALALFVAWGRFKKAPTTA